MPSVSGEAQQQWEHGGSKQELLLMPLVLLAVGGGPVWQAPTRDRHIMIYLTPELFSHVKGEIDPPSYDTP